MDIAILHLYADFLNINGEYGNLLVLYKYLLEQGFNVIMECKTIGDEIDFKKYDLIYMGCGTEKNLIYALNDLKRYENQIKFLIEEGKFILATGNSFEIFGKKIGKEEGLGVFDFEVVEMGKTLNSEIEYLYDTDNSNIVINVFGYVSRKTEIFHNFYPLFRVKKGIGENRRNDYEGVKYKNFYGTHVLGPVLTKNPKVISRIIVDLTRKNDEKFEPKEIII